MCMTKKQKRFVEAIERNTEGLQAVSTGPCSGCEQCRDEYGVEVACECGGDDDCEKCDGHAKRPPTMEEFDEQLSTEQAFSEGFFSWQGCDLCDSSLDGTFEPWHAVDANNEIIHGERACVDCVMYLANGDLPGQND